MALVFPLVMLFINTTAQDKFYTKTGRINFSSKGVIETIEAQHKSVTCVLDTKTGNIQFSILLKGFEFRKALMQEHFNDDYVESNKYPKSEFRGEIVNNGDINYAKDGVYDAKVKGKLTLHGETKDVDANGKITVKNGKIEADSDFNILMSDYKISIPGSVVNNMSNNVKISVNCSLEPLKG
jgi:polyisoprenoid-binding protein YceI